MLTTSLSSSLNLWTHNVVTEIFEKNAKLKSFFIRKNYILELNVAILMLQISI